MSNSEMNSALVILLACMIFILVVLVCIYVFLKIRSKNLEKSRKEGDNGNEENKVEKRKTVSFKDYTKHSIYDFMEFDKVVDNMICQKDGFRYLMVVNCQGVNYDLMSHEEKLGVEQGFVEFLNTLRHPIQIYTQTRTVNLESSIQNYKKRLKVEEDKLSKMRLNYEQMVKSGAYSKEQLQKAYFELTKQMNLYEYGKDIVLNTEKMSLNKNVLNKQYFIIIPYYPSELGQNSFDREEIENMAFSELYTRAQATIRALASCGVSGKVMNSNELVDLLYMAYNRDEAEIFGLDKVLKMGYDELYSTAPDVMDKKIKILNQKIEEEAIALAQQKVFEVKSEKQRRYENMEKTLEDLIEDTAKEILEENEEYLGKEVTKKAKEKVDKQKEKRLGKEEGGTEDVLEEKSTRGRKKKTSSI